MKKMMFLFVSFLSIAMLGTACASSSDRRPAGYSRSGRDYKEPKAMNHRRLDTDSLYQACIRERTELSCRNRLGR